MKFGDYLRTNRLPEWEDHYLDYDALKDLIKRLEELQDNVRTLQSSTGIGTSLSVPLPTNAAAMPMKTQQITQEDFFKTLEREMKKIEEFTHRQVTAFAFES
jgi:SPX domain protein involved in polyphosphate accumulation